MPNQTQSPSKAETKTYPKVFHDWRHPVKAEPAYTCPETVDVYDFGYDDKHELCIVKVGTRCPQKDIDACRPETLADMAARMPGKNSIEKLGNLVNNGIIVPKADDPTLNEGTTDERGMPSDILSAYAAMAKGKAAYDSLPDELKQDENGKEYDNIDALLKSLPPERIKAYLDKLNAPKATETTSNE